MDSPANKKRRVTAASSGGSLVQEQLAAARSVEDEVSRIEIKRKSIHYAIVQNPNGIDMAANTHAAPYAVIADKGKADQKYKGKVLVFLDPYTWDKHAPAPGQDGYIRALEKRAPAQLKKRFGAWRELICFSKKKKGNVYTYLGNYTIITDPDGLQTMAEVQDSAVKPGTESAAVNKISKAIKKTKEYKEAEAEGEAKPASSEWIADGKNWKQTAIKFIQFDTGLWEDIKAMEVHQGRNVDI